MGIEKKSNLPGIESLAQGKGPLKDVSRDNYWAKLYWAKLKGDGLIETTLNNTDYRKLTEYMEFNDSRRESSYLVR